MQRHVRVSLILAIAAGIYFILPLFFGMAAQRYMNDFLYKENRTLGRVLGVHFEFAEYDRGWLSSSAILQVERKTQDGDYEILKKIPLTIDHGPAYRVGNRFQAGFAMMRASNVEADAIPDYTIDLRNNITFSGDHATVSLLPKAGSTTSSSPFHADALVLQVDSNLNADHFNFQVDGAGLRFEDPQHVFSVNIKSLQSTLLADYVSDRHWNMQFGLMSNEDQASVTLPGSASLVTLNANAIGLDGAHFDTEKMVKLVSEILQIQNASEAGQAVPPAAWIALVQEFLTQIIADDTKVHIDGLSLTSPMGQLQGNYNVSFPTLPSAHDYFDIVTHDVSRLALRVPAWIYTDAESNTEFGLSDLSVNSRNNTVFSRELDVKLGAFDIKDTLSTAKNPVLYATGIAYGDESSGAAGSLSQTLQWRAHQLCFSEDCFKHIQGKLDLLKMNFNAYRGIAAATREVVQYDPQQGQPMSAKWMNLANAYINLITPDTRIVLSHDMMTGLGSIKLYAKASWPTLPSAPTLANFLDASVYELRAQFPAAYVDAFLSYVSSAKPKTPAQDRRSVGEKKADEIVGPDMEMQAAQLIQYAVTQGYLKKIGSAFVLDLTGKGLVATINGIPWKMSDTSTATPSTTMPSVKSQSAHPLH